MIQKFYPYTLWEDFLNGMYRHVSKKEEEIFLKKALDFTKDFNLWGEYMLKVLKEWPISCEQNLTDQNINQRAWIGQAACCLAFKCPESITRMAWGYLTEEQQAKANYQADLAIYKWNNPIKKKWF